MVGAYVENGQSLEALDLSQRMHLEGLLFDKVTLISVLRACASEETYIKGKQIHASFLGTLMMTDCRVCNAVMSMYGKACRVEDARTAFGMMEKLDITSWNAMIACYVKNGEHKQATLIFQQMQHQSIHPSPVTFITILSACKNPDALFEGRSLHSYIIEVGFDTDVGTGDALISMYGMCGALEDAHKVFRDLPYRDKKLWMTVMTAYFLNGKWMDVFPLLCDDLLDVDVRKAPEASALFACTSQSWIDTKAGSVPLNKVCENGWLDITQTVFDIGPMRDTLTWNAVNTVYAARENIAPKNFVHMHGGKLLLDKHMCASIFSACATSGDLKTGKRLHAWILCNDGFEIDSRLWNAVTNLYGKCGSIEDTQNMFNRMPYRDAVSWTILIEAYDKHANGEMALQFFQHMLLEGVNPDMVTLVGVSSTCSSHSALMQGKQLHVCFEQSVSEGEVSIGNALINMYAKCGSLHIARRVFDTMAQRDLSSWNVIITGYAQCGQIDDALCLFWQMQERVISPNIITLVSVLSACSHAGLSFDAWNHFSFMHSNYGVNAVMEHYNSLIDAFGRSGRLDLADSLVKNMPCQPNIVSWMAFLGACRYHVDLKKASCAANIILEMDHCSLAPRVLLANVYAANGQVECSTLRLDP